MSTTIPAVAALRRYLADGNRSQNDLARDLGVKQPSVSGWLRGTSRPEPHLREALEIITGVPASAWDSEDERAFVERVRQRVIDPNTIADDAPLAAVG